MPQNHNNMLSFDILMDTFNSKMMKIQKLIEKKYNYICKL